jgi:hypothetical protein
MCSALVQVVFTSLNNLPLPRPQLLISPFPHPTLTSTPSSTFTLPLLRPPPPSTTSSCTSSSHLPLLPISSSCSHEYNMYLTRRRKSRYSMPASGMKSQQRSSVPTHQGLGPLNTTSFLFDDNDDQRMSAGSQGPLVSPHATSFLQMTPNDDNFPTLRSDRTSGIVSA